MTLNATILDRVRLQGSNDYQQRVPQADQVGIDAVADVLEGNRTLFNEFHENLVNIIGSQIVRDRDFYNPFAEFKRENLRMGQAIQEIAVDLIKGNGYDMRDNNVFKRSPATVYAKIHELNRRARYDLTINPTLVAQALRTPDGLSELLAQELKTPGISDQYDEFQIFKNLIARAFATRSLFRVNTPFANPEAPTADELRALSTAIRAYAEMAGFLSTLYNAAGIPVSSTRSDLVLMITPIVKASLDVNVLADAFHIDRADFASRVIVVDKLPMAGAHAVLVDKNFFVAADYINEMTSFYNPKSLETNFYLHRQGVYSYSPYVNAFVFGDFATDIVPTIDITLDGINASVVNEEGDTVTSFAYGDNLKLVVETTAEIDPANPVFVAPAGYEAFISIEDAAGKGVAITPRTAYTRDGYLRVQDGLAPGTKIKIDVVSTYIDPSGDGDAPAEPLSDSVTITVAQPVAARTAEKSTAKEAPKKD